MSDDGSKIENSVNERASLIREWSQEHPKAALLFLASVYVLAFIAAPDSVKDKVWAPINARLDAVNNYCSGTIVGSYLNEIFELRRQAKDANVSLLTRYAEERFYTPKQAKVKAERAAEWSIRDLERVVSFSKGNNIESRVRVINGIACLE